MKKNQLDVFPFRESIRKIIRVMKLVSFFLLVGFLQVSANIYSQTANIKLSMQETTLCNVIKEIQKQTEFIFFYSPDDIRDVTVEKVDLENASLEKTLDLCLKGTDISYEIVHKAVILKKEEIQQEYSSGDASVLSPPAEKEITGKVTDQKGNPIPGATVVLKGTTIGIVTDMDGNFKLKVPLDAKTLSISFVGYNPVEILIGTRSSFSVTLEEMTVGLEEVVAVGYGTQKKISTTGSLSTVTNKDIMKAPVANLANALTGIMPGLTVVNTSGRVGKVGTQNDGTVIRLRGIGTMSGQLDPLIMVDGMERPMNDIDPNEIESVTILKDASSTAVFGVRGANGVILVTTKRGTDGPAKVSFAAEYGISKPTRLPKFLNSYDYATLYNEAQINDGVNPANVKYSAEAIEHFRTGDDPWLYPDTDWQEQLMRDISPQQRYNLNISGGTKSTKYYISTGYLGQTGIWKNFNNGYDNSDWAKRYNFRSNLDIDVTKDITVSVSLGGTIRNVNLPNAQRGINEDEDWQFFRYMMNAPPMAGAGWINGKSYIVEGYDTPINYMAGNGLRNNYNSELNTLFSVDYKLDFITKGLKLRSKYGYDSNYTINLVRRFSSTFPEYSPVRKSIDTNGDGTPEDLLLFKQIGSPSKLSYTETVDSKRRHIYFEAALEWKRTFANNHDVTGLVLYNQSKKYYTESAFNEIPLSYLGLVSRFTYSYKSKYNAEINMGYNGSENFPKDKRFGFFPSYSASWVVSEEPFMKNVPFISFLKFKVSYGKAGNDRLGSNRFLYIPDSYSMSYSGGPLFGVDGAGQGYGTASVTKRGNPDVSWEIDEKQNYAVEMKLFNKLSINFDYFHNFRSDILRTKSTYTAYVDDKIPPLNFGKMSNHGYELEATWRETRGKFNYWIKGIYAFARNKVIEMDEPTSIPEWQKQTGRPLGCPILYLVKGFYETQEQVDAANGVTSVEGIAVNTLGKVRKGDLWYEDYNKDGKINDLDRVSYGNYTQVPEITGSVSLGASYKGFDFNILFQGVTNALVSYGAESLQPFTCQYLSIMSAQTYVKERWTEATKETARFPALTVVPNHYNFGGAAGYVNEFFTNDASYIRLKNLEFGYTFSGRLLKSIKCRSLRIYVNGSNLITWDRQKLFDFDPEQPGSRTLAYPQVKIYNIGLNLQF
ncbi:MAG: hypothetical protein A2W90_07850 [Bacteroidetes bacterium GWF2_42_66]|nr:MAG: hypothetical protein A2W92_20475 [Bacteroidetes bacterium GWA2_42_15]OFX99708.1 MAG: hypothetical protein A2W89_03015 [Bacteroidetes bacterium GWE2_42_39]OFY39746.1 MAG: hypothetical protein A2W90_07850 [Bacteroidetes bacterium GWF2_42_66]HAZ02576.1 SusC/RagA family TonB-linked outer membrane protein [Marinilabiliales bacterium]HBL74837.1 SusC/RagA family TonB-linked outer membrane protein [Prolixibacteraceae bacterium]